jgi:hypothetical protein
LKSQSARKGRRSRKTWRRTTEEEITEMGKTWREIKALADQRGTWRSFTKAHSELKELSQLRSRICELICTFSIQHMLIYIEMMEHICKRQCMRI